MNNEIYKLFQVGFSPGYFKRTGDSHNLNLYIGKDKIGHYAFEYRGEFVPIRVNSSELISVEQYKNETNNTICFSLGIDDLLERFSIFCQDLVDAVQDVEDTDEGYKVICERFFSWKKLFKPSQGNLSEPEIMGLIGELLFLKETMFPLLGESKAIDSWVGPEKAHKDFSFNDTWVEVKSINSGKNIIRISSVEQLDSCNMGSLVVYRLERMANTYNGINLNALVNDVLRLIRNPSCKDQFFAKIEKSGYDSSPEYDTLVYQVISRNAYIVDERFPRLRRENLQKAIEHVQYDILVSEIDNFKSEAPWK